MRVHEDWREEIGWFLTVLGIAGLLFALGEVIVRAWAPSMAPTWWMVFAIAAVVALVGMGLHMTRPSKRVSSRPE